MEDINQNNESLDAANTGAPAADSVRKPPFDPEALSGAPSAFTPALTTTARQKESLWVGLLRHANVILAGLLILAGAGLFLIVSLNRQQGVPDGTATGRFNTVNVSLEELAKTDRIDFGEQQVVVNGLLQANGNLILAPSVQPSDAVPGQIYYDQTSNVLAYFNGSKFIPVAGSDGVVSSIGGLTGEISLGAGLTAADGQLTVTPTGVQSIQGQAGNVVLNAGSGITVDGLTISNAGVQSLQGQTGAVTLTAGNGIAITGTTITNTGVNSVSAGSPNVSVADDGNGNVSVSVTSGAGTVTSSGGTAGAIPVFTDDQNIEDSIITQSGVTVTVNGDLAVVTGGLSLSNALTVDSGGIGTASLAANGVLIGNGTAAISSVVAGSSGLCLLSTAGAPAWQACPGGGGVTSLNSLTGTLNIANASGAGSTITIDNASTTAKGIAQFNSADFTASTGTISLVNTVTKQGNTFNGANQLVQLNASGQLPAVSGALLTNLNASALATGTVANARLQGGGALSVTAGTGLSGGGSVALGGNTTLTVDYGSSAGTAVEGNQTISVSAGTNLTGGGSITLGAGGNVTVNVADSPAFAGNVAVQGGGLTVGADSVQGSLTLYDGGAGASAFTGSLQVATLGEDKTYILPDFSGSSAAVCLSTGNCAGAGGGITGSGTTNQLSKFTASGTIGDSSISDDGATVTASADMVIQGGSLSVGTASQTGSLALYAANGNTTTLQAGNTGAALTFVLPGVAGNQNQCLKKGTGNQLFWDDCEGGQGGVSGVTALNSLSGALTLQGTASQITVNDNGSDTITLALDSSVTLQGNTFNGASQLVQLNASSQLPAVSGALLTSLNASALATGTVANARLVNGGALTVTAGTNLTGGGSVALGGNVTVDVVDDPSFTGDIVVQGGSAAVGADGQAGALSLFDGGTGVSAFTGTLQVATLNADKTYVLPDIAGTSADICLDTGNCAGAGGGVTTGGGTAGTIAVFTGSQTIGDSLLSQSGGTVTVGGNLNLTTGSQYRINGVQIASSNLSDSANLAKLNQSQTFTGGNTFSVDSTNALTIQNATTGNTVVTADTTNGLLRLGQASNLSGQLVFNSVSSANTVTILPGSLTANRTLTLPDASGVICTDSGNCAGAGATLQTAYNFSVGGTTPKIKVDDTLLGVDIQDADTTIGANLFNVRASNNGLGGLGQVMFGVGSTGQITLQNSENSNSAFRLLTQAGTSVLTGDTQNGRVILGQSGTLSGSLVFNHAGSAFTGTIAPGALTADRAYTLPNVGGTICVDSGNCAGAGGGVTTGGGTTNTIALFTASQEIGDSIITQSGTTVDIAGSLTLDNALGVANGGTGLNTTPTNGQLLIGNGTGYSLATLTNNGGLTVSNGSGTIGLAVNYGATANTAVQGNQTLVCPSGTGNLNGGGNTITLGSGGTCTALNTVANPSFGTSVTTPLVQGAGLTVAATGANSLILATNGNTRLTVASGGDLTATGSMTLQGGTLTTGADGQQGSVSLFDGGAGAAAHVGTLRVVSTLGQDAVYTLPDAGGDDTICLVGLDNCASSTTLQQAYDNSTDGSAAAVINLQDTSGSILIRNSATGLSGDSGRLFAVQNNTGTTNYLSVDTAGIFISGNVVTNNSTVVGTTFRSSAPGSGNSAAVTLQSGNAASGDSGNVTIDAGTASGTKGSISIGTTNASAVSIGNTGATTTVRGNNSSAAFQIQDASGEQMFGVDTAGKSIVVPSASLVTAYGGFGSFSNMLQYSEQFDNAAWIPSANLAVTADNVTAPNGTTTADTITTTATAHNIRQVVSVSASTTYTFSWWAKAGTMSAVKYSVRDMTNSVDLIPATDYVVGTGWQRFSVTFTTGGTTASISVYPIRDSGVTGTVQFWGAQLEQGSSAGSYLTTEGTTQTSVRRGLTVDGQVVFKSQTNSDSAFKVINGSGVPLFQIDMSTNRVYVGNFTADSTGALLVLDTKNTSGDPTGVDGGMYYNSNDARFRCYEGGAWRDCIGSQQEVVTFTSSGTFNKANYPGMRSARIQVQAGGGGGAGAVAVNNQFSAGSGGGGGAYAESLVPFATLPSGDVTVTVGSGGAGGTGANGSNGGDSSFGSLVIADGGGAGSAMSAGTSVAYGNGGGGGSIGSCTGDLIILGDAGGPRIRSGVTSGISGEGGGAYLGSSVLGMDVNGDGRDGVGYGGGGSGGRNGTSGSLAANTGGIGAPGVVIITILY